MPARKQTPEGVEVAIVSPNPETLDGLQSYLEAAGVVARCTRDLEGTRAAPQGTRAFVLFPDDYRWESVVSVVADLTAKRPAALPLLVTAQPKKFEKLAGGGKVVVVPRPVWGWTILDAIRAHVTGARDGQSQGGAS